MVYNPNLNPIPRQTGKFPHLVDAATGPIILGMTHETEVLVDCPVCAKGIRWRKYHKPSGNIIAVMFTYCKCEFQGKRKRKGARV